MQPPFTHRYSRLARFFQACSSPTWEADWAASIMSLYSAQRKQRADRQHFAWVQ